MRIACRVTKATNTHSEYTCLINSTVSSAVFPSLKQNLMFALCTTPLLWPRPLTTCTTWRRISRHAQRGRCGFARLQMKVGHMDGMHCFMDSTSILVKIISVSLYNCRTVYVIPIAFPLQKWLHDPTPILRYTYIACLHFPVSRSSRALFFTLSMKATFVCTIFSKQLI